LSDSSVRYTISQIRERLFLLTSVQAPVTVIVDCVGVEARSRTQAIPVRDMRVKNVLKGGSGMLSRTLCLVFLLIVACLMPVSAHAQAPAVTWGLQGGLGFSKAAYDPGGFPSVVETEDRLHTGFIGGANVTFPLPGQHRLSLETGMYFQMKGGKTKLESEFATSEEYVWKLNYLSIPVLAKVSLSTGKVHPYLKAGPELGVLLSANRFGPLCIGCSPPIEQDIKDSIKPWDIGLLIAGGVQVPMGSKALFAELSYTHGFIDVNDPEDAEYDVKVKNRVVGMGVGIRF